MVRVLGFAFGGGGGLEAVQAGCHQPIAPCLALVARRLQSVAQNHQLIDLGDNALLFSQRAWYAVGHHGGRDAVRQLKLNRFTLIEPTDKPYTVPEDFSIEKHLGYAWRMIRGQQRHDVRLRFDAAFAETIADTRWHATQQIDWHDDGSITFCCQVDGLDEIVWWVLSMGPHCVVEAPDELAERVRSLAADVVANYAEAEAGSLTAEGEASSA